MRRASNIALIAAAALAVLVFGGVHTTIAAGAGVLALVAFALQIGHLRSRDHRSVYVSSVGLGLLLAALVSFLQLIPVPEIVQRVLSPHGWGIVSTGFEAAGLTADIGWRTLSMDPRATADRAVRFTALGLFSLAGANVYMRHAWRPAARVVIGLALASTVVGGALWLTGAHSIAGFFESEVGFRAPGTFVNTNHGAVLHGFAAIVATALALNVRSRRPIESAIVGVLAFGLLANCVWHNSEGTNLALGATACVAAVLVWFRAGRPIDLPLPTRVAVGAIAVLALVLAWWLDVDLAVRNYLDQVLFGGEHGNRLALVRAGFAAAADYWPAGAGIGTTETVIPAYIDWSEMLPASIPVLENDTAELLMGAGWLLGPLILVCLVLTPVLRVRAAIDPGRSDRFVVATLVAFFGVVIAQMHFPLFALGIGAPIVTFLEVAWSRRMRPSEGHRFFRSGHVAIPTGTAAVLAAVAAVGLIVAAHAQIRGYRLEASRPLTPEDAAAMLRLRPADHRTYVRLATAAAREGDPERATRLARLAMSREPSPRVRLFLARAFALHDTEASVAEYRRLFEVVAPAGIYLDTMLEDVDDADVRAALVGEHPERWWVVANQIRKRDGAEPASSFVVALVTDHPGDVRAYRAATRLYMRLEQMTLARMWAEILADLEEQLPADERTAAVFLAKALAAEGRRDEAREALARSAREGAADDVNAFALRLRGGVEAAESDDIEDVRAHYDALCASPVAEKHLELCWQTEAWLAEADGDYTAARHVLDRLYRRYDQAVPLAAFYHRYGRCRRIEVLLAQMEPDTRASKRVRGLLRGCTQAFE